MKRIVYMYVHTYIHTQIALRFAWHVRSFNARPLRYACTRVHREQPRVPKRMKYRVTRAFTTAYSNAFSHAWRKKRAYENEGIVYTAVLNQVSPIRERNTRVILKITVFIKKPIFLLISISIFNLIFWYLDILSTHKLFF